MHSTPIAIIDLLALLVGVLTVLFLMPIAPVWGVVISGFLLVYFVLLFPKG